MFLFRSFFRFLNVLGNILLWMEYDRSRHYHPRMPRWRKYFVNPVTSTLIFWTYPESVEQKYRLPPRLVRMLRYKISQKLRATGGS